MAHMTGYVTTGKTVKMPSEFQEQTSATLNFGQGHFRYRFSEASHAHLNVLLCQERGWTGTPQKLAELLYVGRAPVQGLPLKRPDIEASVHLRNYIRL